MQWLIGLNHIAIAASDPEKARFFFHKVMGLRDLGSEIVAEQNVEVSMLALGGKQSARIELLEATGPQSTVASFVAKKGGGIHHLAFLVSDIDATIAHLRANGIDTTTPEATRGAHGTRVVFAHPHATGGVLVEFVEGAL